MSDLKNGTETRPVFIMSYKVGPVRKDQMFFATDEDDAQRKAEKYVQFIGGLDNSKVLLIGKAKPFALDIEKEMARLKKSQEVNIYPV